MTMSDVFGEEEFKKWIQDAISMPFTKEELETVLYKPQSDSTAIAQHLKEHFQISKQQQQQQQSSSSTSHPIIDSSLPPSKVERDSSVLCKNREGGIVLKVHILDFLKRMVIFTNSHKTMLAQIEAKRELHAKTASRISSTFPLCSDYLKSTQSEILPQESPKQQLQTTHSSMSPKTKTHSLVVVAANQSQSNYKKISKEPYILYRNKSTYMIAAAQQKQKSQNNHTISNFNTVDQQLQNYASTKKLKQVNDNHSSPFKKLSSHLNSYSTIVSSGSSSPGRKPNHYNKNKTKKQKDNPKVRIINSTQKFPADYISLNSTMHIQNDEEASEHPQLQSITQNAKHVSNSVSPPRHATTIAKQLLHSSQISYHPKNQIPFEGESENLNQSHQQKQLHQPINRLLLQRRRSTQHSSNKDNTRIASKSRTIPHRKNQQVSPDQSPSIPNSSTTVATSSVVSINENESNSLQQFQLNNVQTELQLAQPQKSKYVPNVDKIFKSKVNKLGYSIVDARRTIGAANERSNSCSRSNSNMIFKNNNTKQLISKMQYSRKYDLGESDNNDLNQNTFENPNESQLFTNYNRTSNSNYAFPKRKMSIDSLGQNEMQCSRQGFKGHLTKRPQSQQSECRNQIYNRQKDSSSALLYSESSTIFEPSRMQSMCVGIAPKYSTRVKFMNLSRSPSPEKRAQSSGNTSVLATATAVVADVKSTQLVVRKVKQPQLICKILSQYFDNKSFI